MGWHESSRHDPAVFHLPRWCRASLFPAKPSTKRRNIPTNGMSYHLAQLSSRGTRDLSAVHSWRYDELHVRRYADANRSRLHLRVSAYLCSTPLAVDRLRSDPVRLLAGLGSLSSPECKLPLRVR